MRDEREHSRKRRDRLEREGLARNVTRPKPNLFRATIEDLNAPDTLEQVHAMAQLGASDSVIAGACGMTLPALKKHCDEHPDFRAAIDSGRAYEELHYVSNLRRMADDPAHPACAISNMFLLKTRAGYRERSDPNNRGTVIIQLPSLAPAMSAEQYMQTLQLVNAPPQLEHDNEVE